MSKPKAIAAALAGSTLLMLIVRVVGPVWQLHDDAVYALLADGRVIVDEPIKTIPHMHPFVGLAVEGIRSLGADYSYATYLYLCLALAVASIYYRIIRDAKGPGIYVLAAAAVLPFVLLPSFTQTAGFLGAAAAVLWLRDDGNGPDRGELFFGIILLVLAVFFRLNMAVLAAACFMPIVFWNIVAGGKFEARVLAQFLVAGIAVVAVFWTTSAVLSDRAIPDFKRLNKPASTALNFGHREAYQAFDLPPPDGVTETQLELLWHWFLADPALTNPETMSKVLENVPVDNLMTVRYWAAYKDLTNLPFTLSFWVFIAAIWLASMSRLRGAIFSSFALFLLAAVYFSVVKKPFPERILLPIASGLLLMGALSTRPLAQSIDHRSRWRGRAHPIAALLFLLPVGVHIIVDRIHLARETDIWRRDSLQLASFNNAYAFVGLPFRAASRPFDFIGSEPDLKILGAMYLVPAVQQAERETGCGGLVRCLIAGHSAHVIGSSEEIQLLETLIEERSGQDITVESKAVTDSFTVYQVGPPQTPP